MIEDISSWNLWTIFLGIIAGYIASKLQRGESSGCIVNLFLGIIGAWVGGFLYGLVGIFPQDIGWIGQLIMAVIGAVIVLWLFSAVRGKK